MTKVCTRNADQQDGLCRMDTAFAAMDSSRKMRLDRAIAAGYGSMTDDPSDTGFDEAAYLANYPDVRAAVEAGIYESGCRHYELHGRAEGRSPVGAGTRHYKLLRGLNLQGMIGMEIGALTAPIVRKSDGPVIYVDHADTETLKRKYASAGIDLDQMVSVDVVWGKNTLQDCIGATQKLDYVVNSHVVEHVPDLVSWLAEIHTVLKPDGVLRMAIPDRRYTFDYLRRESSLADVLDAYIRRTRVPLPHAILDHFLYHCEVDSVAAWEGALSRHQLHPTHTAQFALEIAERILHTGDYQDTHCWVFTPVSFAQLCAELANLKLLHFACDELHPTEHLSIEFIVSMRPAADPADCVASWQNASAQMTP
jgi:SAM-dependent methyltransferase